MLLRGLIRGHAAALIIAASKGAFAASGVFAALMNPGPVAQRLVQETHNLLVAGSNPAGPTIHQSSATCVGESISWPFWPDYACIASIVWPQIARH